MNPSRDDISQRCVQKGAGTTDHLFPYVLKTQLSPECPNSETYLFAFHFFTMPDSSPKRVSSCCPKLPLTWTGELVRADDAPAWADFYRSSSVYWRMVFTEAQNPTASLYQEINRLRRRLEVLEDLVFTLASFRRPEEETRTEVYNPGCAIVYPMLRMSEG